MSCTLCHPGLRRRIFQRDTTEKDHDILGIAVSGRALGSRPRGVCMDQSGALLVLKHKWPLQSKKLYRPQFSNIA